jgi:hypothetical protein
MTYLLNVIAVGDTEPIELRAGQVIADPDEPSTGQLAVGTLRIDGAHYLIVMEDGAGYRSSMRMVSAPSDPANKTTLSIPEALQRDATSLIQNLWWRSPTRQLGIYLEANRIISRPAGPNDVPAQPRTVFHATLQELLDLMNAGALREEEIHVVGYDHSA